MYKKETNVNKIVLASGSPRRRELLEQIGINFEVITSNADENITEKNPEKLVCALSKIKAEAVFKECAGTDYENAIFIGADTIVYHEGRVLGKPKTKQEAVSMLKSLSGNEHSVFTGVTLLSKDKCVCFAEETKVRVSDMTDEEIAGYAATDEPMDKAGAYGIQGRFAAYVKGITGDYNNVVGLPVCRVYQELKKF
jgi:septum formation protein